MVEEADLTVEAFELGIRQAELDRGGDAVTVRAHRLLQGGEGRDPGSCALARRRHQGFPSGRLRRP
jgi:hypothetical protein